LLDFLKGIPWYPVLIILLVLLGTGLIVNSILIKDTMTGAAMMSLIRGSSILGVGTVLNALNTLSYMLDPDWFGAKTGLGLSWLLGLDLVNLSLIAFLCVFLLIVLSLRLLKREASLV
jgi:hypothetical protein